MSIVYGPKWPFYSCWDYIGLFGTGICRYCIWVELPVQRTLPDFLKWRRVTRHPLVFRGLTGSQRTPGLGRHRSGNGRTPTDPFCFLFLQRNPTPRANGPVQQIQHALAQFRLKKHHQFGAVCGNDSSFTNKANISATDGTNSTQAGETSILQGCKTS